MAFIAVTNTFTNGTTADATEVNENFQDIVSGLQDGSKNITISAITAGSTATFNSAVSLGASTANDITWNGSLASTINIKTTYTYDIGTATIGLRSVYLGDSGAAARSTRLIGAAVGSSWTMTLPTGAGTDGYGLITNGSGATSWQPFSGISNIGISATVGSSALTVALKTASGADASATDPIYVSFRNATLTTGTPVIRKITGALSVVVSSGSTLGSTSGNANWVYVYLVDNGGTVVLAVSGTKIADEGSIVSTTAEGGAGAADSKTTLYATSGLSNLACRLIGRVKSTQATAGTWATAPSEISVWPFDTYPKANILHLTTGNGHGSSGTYVRRFTTTVESIGSAFTYADSSTNGMSVTINEDGIYAITFSDSRSGNPPEAVITKNASNLTVGPFTLTNGTCLATAFSAINYWAHASFTGRLYAGDVIRAQDGSSNDDTSNRTIFRIEKISD